MIATVRRTSDLDRVDPAVAHAIALDTGEPAAAIRSYAPRGVDRIIEVTLSDNADLDNAVAAQGAVIAAYATRADRTEIPFWPLLFNNVTLRLLGSDDFPAEASQAARNFTSSSAVGALTVAVGDCYPLDDIAKAHDHVDAGGGHGRIPHRTPDSCHPVAHPDAQPCQFNTLNLAEKAPAGGMRGELEFDPVHPETLVEFLTDTAVNNGRHRHPVSFLRVREDLTADQLPRFGA